MNIHPQQSRRSPRPLIDDLLHAIGQPLTSLQMCILLRDRPSLDRRDFAGLMQDMAGQVALLSRLFGTLRQVLSSDVEPTLVTEGELKLLLRKLLPQWQRAAQLRDIAVNVTGVHTSDSIDPGSVPYSGSLHICLQEIVAAALESTPDGGSITVALALGSGAAPFRLRIVGGDLLSEGSFLVRFGLPAAKLLLDLSEQEFTYSLNPFEAHLVLLAPALPVAEAAAIDRSSSAREGYAGFAG